MSAAVTVTEIRAFLSLPAPLSPPLHYPSLPPPSPPPPPHNPPPTYLGKVRVGRRVDRRGSEKNQQVAPPLIRRRQLAVAADEGPGIPPHPHPPLPPTSSRCHPLKTGETVGRGDANFPLREFLQVGCKAAQTNHWISGGGSSRRQRSDYGGGGEWRICSVAPGTSEQERETQHGVSVRENH